MTRSQPLPGDDSTAHDDAAPPVDPHTRYARTLHPEERQLLRLRAELYDNSWDRMLADLNDRLKGRPYIFKIVHRIEEDIHRVQKLQSYEQKHLIDLMDYLEPEPGTDPDNAAPGMAGH
ncbi:MAG: hypothetical protein AB7K09_19055 [Planctomycetota bacterium]